MEPPSSVSYIQKLDTEFVQTQRTELIQVINASILFYKQEIERYELLSQHSEFSLDDLSNRMIENWKTMAIFSNRLEKGWTTLGMQLKQQRDALQSLTPSFQQYDKGKNSFNKESKLYLRNRSSPSFDTLDTDIHMELLRYLSPKDCQSLSQVSSSLQKIYRELSWRYANVVPIAAPPKNPIQQRSRSRLIPVDVFLRPQKYSWFLSQHVIQLSFTLMQAESGLLSKAFLSARLRHDQFPSIARIIFLGSITTNDVAPFVTSHLYKSFSTLTKVTLNGFELQISFSTQDETTSGFLLQNPVRFHAVTHLDLNNITVAPRNIPTTLDLSNLQHLKISRLSNELSDSILSRISKCRNLVSLAATIEVLSRHNRTVFHPAIHHISRLHPHTVSCIINLVNCAEDASWITTGVRGDPEIPIKLNEVTCLCFDGVINTELFKAISFPNASQLQFFSGLDLELSGSYADKSFPLLENLTFLEYRGFGNLPGLQGLLSILYSLNNLEKLKLVSDIELSDECNIFPFFEEVTKAYIYHYDLNERISTMDVADIYHLSMLENTGPTSISNGAENTSESDTADKPAIVAAACDPFHFFESIQNGTYKDSFKYFRGMELAFSVISNKNKLKYFEFRAKKTFYSSPALTRLLFSSRALVQILFLLEEPVSYSEVYTTYKKADQFGIVHTPKNAIQASYSCGSRKFSGYAYDLNGKSPKKSVRDISIDSDEFAGWI